MKSSADIPNYDELWTNVYGDIQKCGPVHRHMRRIVSRILEKLDYQSVLDVGCGPGDNYPMLSKGRALSDFAGIDISALAVEQAKKNVRGNFLQFDIQKTHPAGLWDLVYCSLVMEHLPDDMAALRNMRSVTGKYLLITTMAGDFERHRSWDELVGHVRNYKKGELEEKLSSAGFRVSRSIYWGFPFFSPLARNLQTDSKAGLGKFSKATRLLTVLLYWLYFLNSYRKGDLLIILAEV